MTTTALLLAILSLGISASLAAIKIWETFLSKSRFRVDFQWFDVGSEVDLRLSLTIANVGHRPDSIRRLHIRAEDGEVAFPDAVNMRLPQLLQPAEISPRFDIDVRTDVAWDPHTSMFVGTATLVLENSVGRSEAFPIPNPYDVGIFGADEPPPPGA